MAEAEALFRRHEYATAASAFAQAAIGASPAQAAAAHNRRGLCLSKAGGQDCHQQALAAYDQAVALQPSNSMFRYNRGYKRRVLGMAAGTVHSLLLPAATSRNRPVLRVGI